MRASALAAAALRRAAPARALLAGAAPLSCLSTGCAGAAGGFAAAPRTTFRAAPAPFALRPLLAAAPAAPPAGLRWLASQAAPSPSPAPSSTEDDAYTPPCPPTAPSAAPGDTSVSEKAAAVFQAAWTRLEKRLGDRLACPREIVFLMGAPGSGKSANRGWILETRGLTRCVTMSALLESNPAIVELMAAGELVPDSLVADALLASVCDPDADPAGLLVDGFPRTALQVDLLKLLHDKCAALHVKFADTSDEWRFPRPSFKVVVLYVDQDISIARQLSRARLAATHNARVLDAGVGELHDVRATDADARLAARRYAIYKAHFGTIVKLKNHFSFSVVDACGSLADTRAQILRELRYQSSLDLDEATYAVIRHLPLAADLVRESRQALVSNLDRYRKRHGAEFQRVVGLITADVVPLLRRCALAGYAEFVSSDPALATPLAQRMLVDVLTDRGFCVAHTGVSTSIPARVDLTTGAITCDTHRAQRFRITFDRGTAGSVRDVGGSAGAAALPGELIGGSSAPSHVDHSLPGTEHLVGSAGARDRAPTAA